VTVQKINTREGADAARKYAVQYIPTIVILKDGHQVEKMVGFQAGEKLAGLLNRHLSQ